MAGATFAHNRIVGNLLRHLGNRLAGRSCWALPSDLKTRSRAGNARYPDVTVECGSPALSSLLSSEPRVVFEVLSPSNTLPKQLLLLDDYQSVATMAQVVYVEQDRPSVLSWTRDDPFWPRQNLEGFYTVLALPSLDLSLPLAEIYEGLDFGSIEPA
jgi:Uma2 family endonuclease